MWYTVIIIMTVKNISIQNDAFSEVSQKGVSLLEGFGVTKNEALIYSYLLFRGSDVGASHIASALEMHRQYVYLCIEKLLALGLIEKIVYGKIAKYKAVSPTQIEKIAKRRVYEAEDLVRELNSFSKLGHEQSFEIYSGDTQVQQYEKDFFSSLQENEVQYVISGASNNFFEYFKDLYEPLAIKGRNKKLITYYIGGVHEKERLEYAKKINSNFNFKILEGMPDGVTSTVVRQNSFILYSLAQPPLVYVIKSEILFKEYKAYFDVMWKLAK